MSTAEQSQGATESIPSKLGKFATEQIDKAEVTVTKGVSTVRDSTNTIISKAEEQILKLNKALYETKNGISSGIDTAIKETEGQLKGITPELKKMGEDAIKTAKGKLDGIVDDVEGQLESQKDALVKTAQDQIESAASRRRARSTSFGGLGEDQATKVLDAVKAQVGYGRSKARRTWRTRSTTRSSRLALTFARSSRRRYQGARITMARRPRSRRTLMLS